MKIRFPMFLLTCCLLAWSPGAKAQPRNSIINFSDYSACLNSPDEPIEVQFIAGAAGITSWWWDFGNDQQSTLQRPVVEYDAPAGYDVTLTIDSVIDGTTTIVEENLIQVNQLIVEDDFEDPDRSDEIWLEFRPKLIVDSALEFEVIVVNTTTYDQQNGDIICLNGGGNGRGFPASDGRFFFDLELITEDPRFVEYSAFRLVDDDSPPAILADLRVERSDENFRIRVESLGAIGHWHTLVQENPLLTVGLDWYQDGNKGGVTLRIQEDSEPVVVRKLSLGPQPGFVHVQLGVMNLAWPDDGTSAGKLRVDNFRTCEFKNRPDLE